MLILYSKLTKLPSLKNVCKLLKLKNYSKKNKNEIIEQINNYKASIFIQRLLRSRLMTDDYCPITFEKLIYPFISFKNHKIFRYYDINGLISYFNVSKNYTDPFTKEPLTDAKIKEINDLATYHKLQKIAPKRKPLKIINQTEFLTILCCLNEIASNILNTRILTFDYIYNYAIPHMMTYIYYILIQFPSYTGSIIRHFIGVINSHTHEYKIYIINYLQDILFQEHI